MSKAGKAIGTVAHGINKHGLERKFSARGKTLLAATVVVYLAGAHMRAGEAGDNLRSDLKDKAAPAAASVISGAAEFLGIDNLSVPNLPDLSISTGDNSTTDTSKGLHSGEGLQSYYMRVEHLGAAAALDCITTNGLENTVFHPSDVPPSC